MTLVLSLAALTMATLAVRALAGPHGSSAGFCLAVLVGLSIPLGAILVDETLALGELRARTAALLPLCQTTFARVLWVSDRDGPATPLTSTDLEPSDAPSLRGAVDRMLGELATAVGLASDLVGGAAPPSWAKTRPGGATASISHNAPRSPLAVSKPRARRASAALIPPPFTPTAYRVVA